MSKTPYEIRLDVLQMAQNMLENKAHRDHASFLASRTVAPTEYTEADVLAKAANLYSFVSDNSAVTFKVGPSLRTPKNAPDGPSVSCDARPRKT